jgi:hypothetical protein
VLPGLITPRELLNDEPLLRELHEHGAADARALHDRLTRMLGQLDIDWAPAAEPQAAG